MRCPYEKKPDVYIVYNPELEESGLSGDNQDVEWTLHMQVHLFTKKNYLKDRETIRKLLREAEMAAFEIESMYEKDSGYYHLCFSFSTEEMED